MVPQRKYPEELWITHATLGPLDLLQSQSSLAHNPSLRLRLLVPADDRTRRILAEKMACAPL